jgi:hypothetical protein
MICHNSDPGRDLNAVRLAKSPDIDQCEIGQLPCAARVWLRFSRKLAI